MLVLGGRFGFLERIRTRNGKLYLGRRIAECSINFGMKVVTRAW